LVGKNILSKDADKVKLHFNLWKCKVTWQSGVHSNISRHPAESYRTTRAIKQFRIKIMSRQKRKGRDTRKAGRLFGAIERRSHNAKECRAT